MGRHVLIVDRDAARRATLQAALGLLAAEVEELDNPAQLPTRGGEDGANLALLDLDPAGAALDALRDLRARPGGQSLPVIALVPPGRPDLRLAALRAGAEEATNRDTAPRILQARLRTLLRDREAAMSDFPDDSFPSPEPFAPQGLAEAPAGFLGAPSRIGAGPRLRLGLHTVDDAPGSPLLDGLGRFLGAEIVPMRSARGTATQGLDLVVIDALGTAGDLAQGTQVLALLADLRDKPSTREAATLVLLPGCAVQTAALALDLGAGDVVAAPVGAEEIALRARALLGRKAQADRQRDQLRFQLRAAVTDPLTGLHNLHHADPALRRMACTARREGRHLAVMMLDIDHFKSFNDRYGHATGNSVLIEVGRRLKAVLRPGDLLARIGGEEFLAALPGATLAEARAVAERLRRAVADRPFVIDLGRAAPAICIAPQSFAGFSPPDAAQGLPPGPLRVRVTLSIGVTTASSEDLAAGLTLDDMLARADQALYAAKASGRDAVAAAPAWGQSPSLPQGATY